MNITGRGVGMLSVKMLKPYYVKEEADCIRVVLAYQYFSLSLDEKVYQFVPLESREIRVNRITQQVENEQDVFVFQKGKEYSRVTLSELLKLTDFKKQLQSLIQPYINGDKTPIQEEKIDEVIMELEKENMKRLIDRALEERDYQTFLDYTDKLNQM
ncbi:IDEAL domain-containing protein [Aquibacillus koreensis]|uniref:IDEAL domain-containing protein n=1 Tax=Aquibacillus koreensis TaxID=279446 RepID=A0A9X3WKW3_9BACI|nr:IDEAL domain-containing protein [Aquibacillus koreensis]MCT2537232.1 IDEAL domain-containing protein [Aquibacillus koreensis]MDC3421580.1 IDEAL domain-containing protein [Aquibacillus koreensis]